MRTTLLRILIFLFVTWLVFILSVAGSPLFAQTLGGTLRLTEPLVGDVLLRTRVVSVSLENYAGPPMLACQFNVLRSGTGKILSIAAGRSLADSMGWKFASVVRRASTPGGSDTVRTVFYGPGLASGNYDDIAQILVELSANTSDQNPVVLQIQGVLGAHGTGDNANVGGGSPLRVSYQSGNMGR